jgi:hypothetical protein
MEKAWLGFEPNTVSHLYTKLRIVRRYTFLPRAAYHDRAFNQDVDVRFIMLDALY